VATASLIQTAKSGAIDKSKIVMLNITGGGENRFKKSRELHYLMPDYVFEMNPDESEVLKVAENLF